MKRIIREYNKQLYVNKFKNLHEIEKILEKPELAKLIQKAMDNHNSPISVKEIEFVVNNH